MSICRLWRCSPTNSLFYLCDIVWLVQRWEWKQILDNLNTWHFFNSWSHFILYASMYGFVSLTFSQFAFVFLSSIRLSRSSIHLWPSIGSWLSLLERFPLTVPLSVRKCIRHAQKAVRWHEQHIKTFLQYQGKNTVLCMHIAHALCT